MVEDLFPFSMHDQDWWARLRVLYREVELPFMRIFGGKLFCLTANGHFGSMPHNADPGDIVCVVYGRHVPYVVRPCGEGRYTLIGDCYLHGFMRGEAMSLEIETQEFILV